MKKQGKWTWLQYYLQEAFFSIIFTIPVAMALRSIIVTSVTSNNTNISDIISGMLETYKPLGLFSLSTSVIVGVFSTYFATREINKRYIITNKKLLIFQTIGIPIMANEVIKIFLLLGYGLVYTLQTSQTLQTAFYSVQTYILIGVLSLVRYIVSQRYLVESRS